jgi:MarR family transcriptional regulator, lower aerobic nicotinate degradation pathway regulator
MTAAVEAATAAVEPAAAGAKAAAAPGKRSGRMARTKYRLDEQVGFLMRVAMQRHTAIFMSRMVEGLTQTQFAALARLHEVGACSQNQLGRLIYLDAATTKGVVDRLHARGFITALPDPQDRRRRAIALTESGRAVADKAIKVAFEITRETLKPLDAAEQDAVLRLLRKLG